MAIYALAEYFSGSAKKIQPARPHKEAGVEWTLAHKAASEGRHSASGIFAAGCSKEGRPHRLQNMSKIRERNSAVQHLKNSLTEKAKVSDLDGLPFGLGGREQAEFPSRSLNKSPLAENRRSTRLP